jgi:hypothetical protein
MLKRTLIVVALVALLATSAQAAGPDPTYGGSGGDGHITGIKVDMEKVYVGWPYEYKKLPLCVIPVYMHVGYFVQVNHCFERKIKLEQVECADIGKGTNEFPCYYDCEDVEIRANFEAKLSMSRSRMGSVIPADNRWSASVTPDIVDASGSWNTVTVCVKAWRIELFKSSPGSEVQVGTVTITVKPNV